MSVGVCIRNCKPFVFHARQILTRNKRIFVSKAINYHAEFGTHLAKLIVGEHEPESVPPGLVLGNHRLFHRPDVTVDGVRILEDGKDVYAEQCTSWMSPTFHLVANGGEMGVEFRVVAAAATRRRHLCCYCLGNQLMEVCAAGRRLGLSADWPRRRAGSNCTNQRRGCSLPLVLLLM